MTFISIYAEKTCEETIDRSGKRKTTKLRAHIWGGKHLAAHRKSLIIVINRRASLATASCTTDEKKHKHVRFWELLLLLENNMKNITQLFLLMTLIAALHPVAAQQKISITSKAKEIQNFLHERNPNYYTYRTKFGPLAFQKTENSLGLPAEKIILNGKPLSIIDGEKDAQGGRLFYLLDDLGAGIEDVESFTKKDQKPLTKRLLVSIGGDLNCVKRFMILDFTGQKPYVSQRFGFNPHDQFCLKFKKASWGKKESYITSDEDKYIYYTYGAAFGPIE